MDKNSPDVFIKPRRREEGNSPFQQSFIGGAGQRRHEFTGLAGHRSLLELRPAELPLGLVAGRHGAAVDRRAQVGIDPDERELRLTVIIQRF